jgi:hypothetical protein
MRLRGFMPTKKVQSTCSINISDLGWMEFAEYGSVPDISVDMQRDLPTRHDKQTGPEAEKEASMVWG